MCNANKVHSVEILTKEIKKIIVINERNKKGEF